MPAQPTPPAPEPANESGWIGKLLAVAGVAVTLAGGRGAAAGAGGQGRPAAAGNPGGRRHRVVDRARRCRCPTTRPARWADRCDRAGRHRHRRRVPGRHRDHHHLPLGAGARRAGDRRHRRRRRPYPGPAVGFRRPRAAGPGAADRPGAGSHPRRRPAAGRIHGRPVGRCPSGATGQGLDLDARGPGSPRCPCRC